jgi:hypothetical protein
MARLAQCIEQNPCLSSFEFFCIFLQQLWKASVTREEYKFLRLRYEQLDTAPPNADESGINQVEEAVVRIFAQEKGHELFWEEQTETRVARQQVFYNLAQHGK